MKKYHPLLILPALLFLGAGCGSSPTVSVQTPPAPVVVNVPQAPLTTNPNPAPAPTPTPAPTPEPPKAPEGIVSYTDSGFSPSTITITLGTTVKFQNNASVAMRVSSNPHPVHTSYPTTGGCVGSTFDSCANIAPGSSWSFTFDKAGTWGYHNHLNPGETGTVIVQP